MIVPVLIYSFRHLYQLELYICFSTGATSFFWGFEQPANGQSHSRLEVSSLILFNKLILRVFPTFRYYDQDLLSAVRCD